MLVGKEQTCNIIHFSITQMLNYSKIMGNVIYYIATISVYCDYFCVYVTQMDGTTK